MLPSKGWAAYEAGLRAIGERRQVDEAVLDFLDSLELVEGSELTGFGRQYFHLRFIEEDRGGADEILRHQLLTACPEAAAICQLLANKPTKATRAVAETVLRSQGHGNGLTDRKLGALLVLMSRAGIIDYAKSQGSFWVLAKPLEEPNLPTSIFISPGTPTSNRIWIRRILGECDAYIFWLDKHFLPEGLDLIGEAADGARVDSVQILSLGLDEVRTRKAKRAYRDLVRELSGRDIELEWRLIDSRQVRDTHDRWIITSGRSWNVPNVNAILSGQRSEISASGSTTELKAVFEEIWDEADPHPAHAQRDEPAATTSDS